MYGPLGLTAFFPWFTTRRVCVFVPPKIALTIGDENNIGRSFGSVLVAAFICPR
jgi:hypothetical protein